MSNRYNWWIIGGITVVGLGAVALLLGAEIKRAGMLEGDSDGLSREIAIAQALHGALVPAARRIG